MNKLKRFIFLFLFIILFGFFSPYKVVNADMGPKPFVEISIRCEKKSNYVVTLLSKTQGTGPYSEFSIDGKDYFRTDYLYFDEDIYNGLVVLKEKIPEDENFYLLAFASIYENISEFKFSWRYYPPSVFKLCVYDSINDEIFISSICERYAFSSYFDAEVTNSIDIEQRVSIVESYNYKDEILQFVLRLIITIVIEISLALLFKFSNRSLLILGIGNVVTQISLNVILNVYTYFNGVQLFGGIPLLIICEIFVLLIEMLLFIALLGKKEKSNKIVSYTILANILSFIASIFLWICL